MHPIVWTLPGIDFEVPAYGLCMAVGIVLALLISLHRTRKVGADPATITTVGILGVALGYIGCRGMYVLHYYTQQIESGQMGIRDAAALGGGGEILGGVVLAVVGCGLYLLIRRQRVLLYFDLAMPALLLAMGVGRIGCFMAGCCHGGTCQTADGNSQLAWAMQFPYGSPAYVQQWQDGLIDAPPQLVWTPQRMFSKNPDDTTPQLIPAYMLRRTSIDTNPALAQWVDAALERTRLKKNQPDDPRIAELAQDMARLWPDVPGGSQLEKQENVALKVHVNDLPVEQPGAKPTMAQLRTLAATQHSLWVHPTQLYDAVALALLFVLLSAIFFRQKTVGMTTAWALVLYPINRILQEMIRVDNPHDVWGLTISQFISIVVMVAGIVMLIALYRLQTKVSPVAGKQSSRTPVTAPV